MEWDQVLVAVATGIVGSGLVEMISRWIDAPVGVTREIDPSAVDSLAENPEFCKLVAGLYCELIQFTEQLSIVYCELLGVHGGTDETIRVADPSEGKSSFVPKTVGMFWRLFYNSAVDDSYKAAEFALLRNTVSAEGLRGASTRIHELLGRILAFSRESAALFDSAAESVHDAIVARSESTDADAARPCLQDETGTYLRFYTSWQDSRYVMTEQAVALLMRESDGSLKTRLQSKNLIRAHYLLLGLFGVSGLLLETCGRVFQLCRERSSGTIDAIYQDESRRFVAFSL